MVSKGELCLGDFFIVVSVVFDKTKLIKVLLETATVVVFSDIGVCYLGLFDWVRCSVQM